jgi:hypothetical protein
VYSGAYWKQTRWLALLYIRSYLFSESANNTRITRYIITYYECVQRWHYYTCFILTAKMHCTTPSLFVVSSSAFNCCYWHCYCYCYIVTCKLLCPSRTYSESVFLPPYKDCNFIYIEGVDILISHLIRTWEVPGSNCFLLPAVVTHIFFSFSQSLLDKLGEIILNSHGRFLPHSIRFNCYHSCHILFHATQKQKLMKYC